MNDNNEKSKNRKNKKHVDYFIPYKTTYDLRLSKKEPNLINILRQVQGYEYGFFTVLGVRPLSQRNGGKIIPFMSSDVGVVNMLSGH
ncbi:hypothetical protein [Xenorhabdus sp. BG5]|nr:hypothetical protein [Xenorhabdus sp. BG5]